MQGNTANGDAISRKVFANPGQAGRNRLGEVVIIETVEVN
jgi:hypothetical protein